MFLRKLNKKLIVNSQEIKKMGINKIKINSI